MTVRERARVTDIPGNFYFYPSGDLLATVVRRRRHEYMMDTIGNRRGNNPVTHSKASISGNFVNGIRTGVRAQNVPGAANTEQLTNMFIDEGRFSESRDALATRHYASGAPDKPAVSLPEFFGEMVADLCFGALRGGGLGLFSEKKRASALARGRKPPPFGEVGAEFDAKYPQALPRSPLAISKKAAEDYLAYSFGLAPFVSDLKKLMDLASAFEKRKRELENLKKRGSSKRWTLGTGSYTDVESGDGGYSVTPFQYMPCKWSFTKKVDRQIYSLWKISQNTPLPVTDADVVRQLLGLTSKGVLLATWELVPFSWLVDYFFNIGDFLQGSMNSTQYEVSGGFMYTVSYEESNTGASYYNAPDDYCSISPAELSKKLFTRVPGLPSPTISLSSSFLDGRQLSILGALGLTKT